MRALAAAATALLLGSCYAPDGRCTADADCLPDQVCGADALCVPGTRPPAGDPPVAAPDSYPFVGAGPFQVPASAPSGPQGVLANDTDPDGHALSAVLVSGPTYGELFLAPDGSFVYAPIVGFAGTDAFSYRASDGLLSSAVADVAITVSP